MVMKRVVLPRNSEGVGISVDGKDDCGIGA